MSSSESVFTDAGSLTPQFLDLTAGQHTLEGPPPNFYIHPSQLAALQAFLDQLSSDGLPQIGQANHSPRTPRHPNRAMTMGSHISNATVSFGSNVPQIKAAVDVDLAPPEDLCADAKGKI